MRAILGVGDALGSTTTRFGFQKNAEFAYLTGAIGNGYPPRQ